MSTEDRVLLVSIRPRFADLLFDGLKTVELRRVRPRVASGTGVIIYASSPVCQIVGTASVAAIHEADPPSIWERHGPRTGLHRSEFDYYFAGTDVAIGIELTETCRLACPRPLAELRREDASFRPPQSFRYLEPERAAALL